MIKQKIRKLETILNKRRPNHKIIILPNEVQGQIVLPPNVTAIFFDKAFLSKYNEDWKADFERYRIKKDE